MPKNKNAETRYLILDQLLANRYHNYSTEDLLRLVNEQLQEQGQAPVSKRTIQLDLEYLENGPFQADIEHYLIDDVSNRTNKTVKKRCHRYADPSFSIFKQKLSDDEKYLLSEAMSLLGQFDGLPNLEGLEALRTSLNIKPERQIISFTRNPLENSNLLGELFTAISQKQVVKLHYHTFDKPDEIRTTIVHPYLLKEYNRRWYVFAGTDDTGKLLNFSLDRIDNVTPLANKQYRPYKGDFGERFEDIIGVTLYDGNPLQTITFWVSDNSAGYVDTKPLHESQRNIRGERADELRHQHPALIGGHFFSIECIENYELLRELTSFGKDLIVLSPSDICEKVELRVKEHLEVILSTYR